MFIVNVKDNGITSFHFETKNKVEAETVYNMKLKDVTDSRTNEKVELLENGRNINLQFGSYENVFEKAISNAQNLSDRDTLIEDSTKLASLMQNLNRINDAKGPIKSKTNERE